MKKRVMLIKRKKYPMRAIRKCLFQKVSFPLEMVLILFIYVYILIRIRICREAGKKRKLAVGYGENKQKGDNEGGLLICLAQPARQELGILYPFKNELQQLF